MKRPDLNKPSVCNGCICWADMRDRYYDPDEPDFDGYCYKRNKNTFFFNRCPDKVTVAEIVPWRRKAIENAEEELNKQATVHKNLSRYYCDACGWIVGSRWNYCQHCGSKLKFGER